MWQPKTREFAARMGALRELRQFIEAVCRGAVIARNDTLRIALVAEELFTNSVKHGYGGDSTMHVWLTLQPEDGACRLVYEDEAPPYDPFADPAAPDLEAPVDTRAVGSLGVLLVARFSRSHEYTRAGERNRISLVLPLAGPG
ncbi:MAG: ATP-binding protein [Betaproteobacteria bacterium]|nr:ATP-binding protein [Betaproteobacteria bacterium]